MRRAVDEEARARKHLERRTDASVGVEIMRPGDTAAQCQDRSLHGKGFVGAQSGDEPFRVRLLFEALPPEWFEGKHYRRHYLDVGFADSISARIALNDDVRIRLFVFRDAQAPRFTAQDGQRLGFVMRALRWLHRQQLLGHGLLIANTPLTPAERRVLLGLLDGDTERQIAEKLEQSPNTTHFHVKSIYAKFGVRNRSALAGLWLGKLR